MENSKIKISVIVCTYNRQSLLDKVLTSLVNQKVDQNFFEVIVVDNNSTDKTEEVSKIFTDKNENIKYIKETRQGKSYASNSGIEASRGEYIAFIDDDAIAYDDWVSEMIKFIKSSENVSAFGGPYFAYYLAKKPDWYKDTYGSWGLGDKIREISESEWINGTNMIFRKTLLEDLRGFDTKLGPKGTVMRYGEETNLLVRIKEMSLPIYYVPTIRVKHLVAEYKLNFKFMVGSFYKNGCDSPGSLVLEKNIPKQLFVLVYVSVLGFTKFIFSKDFFIKSRVIDSFKDFIWNYGVLVGMVKS